MNVIPGLHTVCVYSTHLYYTVMYIMCTCNTVTYVTYAFSYTLARDSQDGGSVYTGSFLPKCLPLESQDLICAGEKSPVYGGVWILEVRIREV